MNDLQVFNYNNKAVRTVEKDGEPWFVLKDVCSILGITRYRDTAGRLDEDERGSVRVDTPGGAQDVIAINESGLYNVILRSDKPEAKPFRAWVTKEVLPTIRKTGGYVANDEMFLATYLPNADEPTKQLFRSSLATMRSLNAKIDEMKPQALFAQAVEASDSSILIGELAKLLRQNGVKIGQNRLFEWMRENNYLIKRGKSYNIPTQYSMERDLMEIKERTMKNPDGSTTITQTPLITGKGQVYFINCFLSKTEDVGCA